jgi:hypothetical protein
MATPKASDTLRRHFAMFNKSDMTKSYGKFPNCIGTFPDCPKEIDPKNPADVCKRCPNYKK